MDKTDITQDVCVNLTRYRMTKNDDMMHAETRALFSYWDGLRDGRATPLRSEVDPRDMRCSVCNLFILEDLGSRNIRFRLAGTELVDAIELELRGMSARSIMDEPARESFVELVAETLAEPGVGYLRLRRADASAEQWEALLLPLRSDSGRVDRVLGALHCLEPMVRIGASAPLRFAIEQARITPIEATRASEPAPATGFAEPRLPFKGRGGGVPLEKQALTAIPGGLDREEKAPPPGPRDRAHLRLIEDD